MKIHQKKVDFCFDRRTKGEKSSYVEWNFDLHFQLQAEKFT